MSQLGGELIKVVNELQDKLNPLGIENSIIDLPQIAVIGGQSSGKSSVLESIVGKDFLPRGSGIVTRRPLVLQLINDSDIDRSFGEFLHSPGKRFYDFNDIRDEITAETDREVPESKGISAKPINLKIYSPDVLDLTLVDLPGMTRVAVGNQPKDIEKLIENMILEYISKDNCLILAVTAANQDLATSDALKLAKEVDPSGERTIGVLTKLDLMDAGTNARDILNGRHEIHLKRDFIGVINRSQKDIDDNKDIRKALSDERRFFMEHPAYGPDMADKMGIRYLQEYLQTELSNHIFKRLPPLKPKIQNKLEELNKKLETIEFPLEDSDKEKILAEAYEKMRSSFDAGVGGKAWLVSTEKLNGGTKINSLMNDTYAKEVNKMFYDDNRIRREIGVAIKNAFGTRIGVFVPDTAFISVVANQIELFRKISLDCVDWVTDEIVIIVTECVADIERYPQLRAVFSKFALDFVRESNKKCKSFVEHLVESEKSYMNTINEDFIKMIGNTASRPIPDIQSIMSEKASKQSAVKSDWIKYKKDEYWFVLNDTTLSWYKNETQKDRKDKVDIKGATIKPVNGDLTLVINIAQKELLGKSSLELVFKSRPEMDKWRDWLEEVDGSHNNSSDNISISSQSSISYTPTTLNKTPQDVSYSAHLGAQVEEVKRLVDAYVVILKKKFKDSLPKLCQLELIDSTSKFIAVDFKVRIRQSYDSTGDIIGDDPDREVRIDLETQQTHYTEAIDIIDKFSHMKL